MCLIFIASQYHARYPLIIAANRDEFYDRPTAPVAFWDDYPHVAAGRDKKAGGTWLGITTGGRFAAVTNFRDPRHVNPDAPSRGGLVSDYLTGSLTPEKYLLNLQKEGRPYNGFNLVAGSLDDGVFYYSNREKRVRRISPGLHGLSNHLLDTPWPKVETGRQKIKSLLDGDKTFFPEDLLALLSDTAAPPDDRLPDTGVGLAWERVLSPMFIYSPDYGTRSSSVILVDADRRVRFVERAFEPGPDGRLKARDRVITFQVDHGN
ncbi:MAG: NRDE family protein [Thermodesulfobacteriota bacterium]